MVVSAEEVVVVAEDEEDCNVVDDINDDHL